MIERLIPACILIQIEKYMRKVEERGNLIFKVELISKRKKIKVVSGKQIENLAYRYNIFDINLFVFSDCF